MSVVSEIYWRELDNLPDVAAMTEARTRGCGPAWSSFVRGQTVEADLRVVVADQLRYIKLLEEMLYSPSRFGGWVGGPLRRVSAFPTSPGPHA